MLYYYYYYYIAAQAAPTDDQKCYEVEWQAVEAEEEEAEAEAEAVEEKWLVLAEEKKVLSDLKAALGAGHTYAAALPESLEGFTKVISAGFASNKTSAIDALDSGLKVMKAHAATQELSELWFVTQATQSVAEDDMKGAEVPTHAGIWGLARAFRNEHPGLKCVTLDVAKDQSLAGELKSALEKMKDGKEPEVAARKSEDAGYLVPRLTDCTGKLTADPEISFSADGTYVISGGVGALGLVFAEWMASKGAQHFALLSRSGVPPADSKDALKKLGRKAVVQKCDIGSKDGVAAAMKQIKKDRGRTARPNPQHIIISYKLNLNRIYSV